MTEKTTAQARSLHSAPRIILIPSSTPSPMQDIESAERHNLYEMEKYREQVLRTLESEPPSPPTTITPPVLELLKHRK
jgi:hypothetical protein